MNLNDSDRQKLITIAADAIIAYLNGDKHKQHYYSEMLMQPACTFVTLNTHGELHGCIGNLSKQPLAKCIAANAVKAAFCDNRFDQLTQPELEHTEIEISILSEAAKLEYDNYKDLLQKITRENGVVIQKGSHAATFLPQVWSHFSTKEEFMSHLCVKAGLGHDEWKHNNIDIYIYTVVHFSGPAVKK